MGGLSVGGRSLGGCPVGGAPSAALRRRQLRRRQLRRRQLRRRQLRRRQLRRRQLRRRQLRRRQLRRRQLRRRQLRRRQLRRRQLRRRQLRRRQLRRRLPRRRLLGAARVHVQRDRGEVVLDRRGDRDRGAAVQLHLPERHALQPELLGGGGDVDPRLAERPALEQRRVGLAVAVRVEVIGDRAVLVDRPLRERVGAERRVEHRAAGHRAGERAARGGVRRRLVPAVEANGDGVGLRPAARLDLVRHQHVAVLPAGHRGRRRGAVVVPAARVLIELEGQVGVAVGRVAAEGEVEVLALARLGPRPGGEEVELVARLAADQRPGAGLLLLGALAEHVGPAGRRVGRGGSGAGRDRPPVPQLAGRLLVAVAGLEAGPGQRRVRGRGVRGCCENGREQRSQHRRHQARRSNH